MLYRKLIASVFLTFLLPFVTAHRSKRHQEVARRVRGDVDIHKRQNGVFSPARFTWYDVGLGACGLTNVSTDFLVALNWEQYGSGYPGPQCFKWVALEYNGKTAFAEIMDECMGCPYGGLDFSKGLFEYFADPGVGVLYGSWWFVGEPTPTTTWEPPTTTSTPDYTPPYTPPSYVTPSTTSPTHTPSPVPTTTTSSSTPSAIPTGWAGVLAVPTAGVVPQPSTSNPENILVIYDIIVEFGIMLTMAEQCG